MINVWGADHGGYIKRLSSAVKAITKNKANVIVKKKRHGKTKGIIKE